MKRFTPLGLALSLALAYPLANALPQGAQVVQGQVAVKPGLIQQGSDKAIVNWQSFSIAAGETLRVQQPGVNSVLLNRVVGGDPSLILGQLQANGRVFLVNPRGIVFGRGSQVEVGGLVASTLDLSDTDFLAGRYRFSAGSEAGALQADGSIRAAGGTVALIAPQLEVSGSIEARRVGLAAASTVQVDVEGDGLVLFNLRNDDDRDVALKFSGRVLAEGGGGSAELRAQARAGAAGQVLNMDGLVQARGLRQQAGRIVIDGGTAGDTLVNGSLESTGDKGGTVTVLGQRVALLDAARLDVSGLHGGGSLHVGGGFKGEGTDHNAERTVISSGARLLADATEQGDGGRIAVWSDGRTDMLGQISARGGRLGGDGGTVETSGRQQLNLPSGRVDVSAPQGRAGQWLLDPNDLSIVAGNGLVNVAGATPFATTDDAASLGVDVLNAALSGGANVIVQTTNSGAAPAQSGNITVAANILSAGAATLNLIALGQINYSGFSIGAGSGALNVVLQAGGSVTGGTINTNGGTVSATGSGSIALGSVNSAGLTIVSNSGTVALPTGSVGQLDVTTSNGAVTQSGALTVTGTSGLSTGSGNITLTAANNLQGAVSLTSTGVSQVSNGSGNALMLGTLNTRALTVTGTLANLQLGSGTVDGTLSATTTGTGTITQGGALAVTGATALSNGSGDITLTAANNLQGAVNLTTSGTTQLGNGSGNALTLGTLSARGLTVSTSSANLDLGNGTVDGNLSATTTGTGTITQGGALTVTGATALSNGSGAITLTAANDLQGAVSVTSMGNTQLSNGNGNALTLGTLSTQGLTVSTSSANLQLGSGMVGGNLSATTTGTGTLSQGGALTVSGTTTLNNGSGDITLASANNLQGTVSVTSTGATLIGNGSGNGLTMGALNVRDLTVSTANANLQLGNGAVAGDLSATTTGTGTITQGGALTVTGIAALSNGSGDITLASANDLRGLVNLTTTGTTQISNGSGNALTLGTLNTHGLTVGTSGANLQLGSGTIAGNLSATTTGTGTIAQGAALTVTGTAALSNGAGNITLTSANDLQGAVSLTTTGTTQISNGSGNALTLGTLNAGGLTVSTSNAHLQLGSGTLNGNLSAATTGTGTITQGGALTVTGTTALSNGSGNITLTSANNLQGVVSLASTGATQLANGAGNALTLGTLNTGDLTVSTNNAALRLGTGTVTGSLDARSQGGLLDQAAGGLTVTGAAMLAAGGGNVSLTDANNQWNDVTISGNALDLRSAGHLNILGLSQPSNRALTLSAGGNLSLGPLVNIDTGTANLSLTSLGGSFAAAGNLKGNDIKLEAQTGLTLGHNITAAGNLELTTASGGVTQTTGTLLVTGTTAVTAGGRSAISLDQATNHFTDSVSLTGGVSSVTDAAALKLGTLDTGGLTVNSTGILNLGQGTVAGTLNATSHGGAIMQAGALTLAGATTLDAGAADITLNHAGNDLQAAITATAGAVSLRSANNLHLFALTQQPNKGLELEAGGTLILPAGTGNIDTGTEALTLSSGGVFSTFGTLKGGDVTLKGQSATLAHDITATGALVVTSTAGGINQTGNRISAAGTSSFNAAGQSITLNSLTNQFTGRVSLAGGTTQIRGQGTLGLGSLATGALQAVAGGTLSLGTGSVSGTLSAASSGAITQLAGGLSVSGTSSFNAGGADITLGDSSNSWTGAVALIGRNVQLASGGAVALGNVNASSLALTSGGIVSQAVGATLGLTGVLAVDAGSAAVTLANSGNQLGGAVTLKGGSTQLRTSGALTLATLDTAQLTVDSAGAMNLGRGSIAGNLAATSGNGVVTQASGGLNVTGTASINAGTADITLDDVANSWTGAVGLTGRDVRLSGIGAVSLGAVGIRSLVLKAGGVVTQSAPLSLTGVLNVDAGSAAITLDDIGNQLGGLVALKGGSTRVTTSAGLTLGQLDTGGLTLAASGTVSLGQGNVAGNLVANSGNGAIGQSGALHVTGSATFTSGTGNITLADAGNQFLGALSLTGNAVTIFNQPSLSFGTLSFNSLDATSNGSITLGSGALSGSLTARALGGSITQVAGGLTVAGNATLQASSGISMTDAANHLNGVVSLSGSASAVSNAGNLRLGTLATAGLTLNVAGTLDLGSGAVGGVLTAVSSGAISQSGALSVSGGASLNAGSAGISLGLSGNAFAGSVDLRGGNTLIAGAGALNLGSLSVAGLTASSSGPLRLGTGSVAGNLDARSGGALTQAGGGLVVAGVSALDAGNSNIQLGEAANAFAGAVSLVGGDVQLVSSGALRLGGFTVHDLKASAGGDLDVGGGTVNGELTATTRGSKISQSAALTVKGVANFVADGGLASLVLDQPGNQLLGGITMRGVNGGSFASANISSSLDLSFSGDVQTLTLSSGGVLTLGGGHSDTLTAGASKGIVLTGPLEVTGLTTLIANGTAVPVDLATRGAGNDLNRVVLQAQAGGSLGRVQLRDGDGSRHDGLKVSGDADSLEITSNGAVDLGGGSYGSLVTDTAAMGAAISQSGALTVSGLTTLKAGSGSITLARPDNILPSLTVSSAGVASIVSAGGYTVNASSVSTRLELGGPGAITLAGPLSGSGELLMSGSGSLTMATAQAYTGGTRIASGRVVLQGPAAQAGSGAVQLGAAGQLDLRDGASLASELVAQGGDVLNTSGSGTLAGAVTLQATTRFLPGAGGLTVSGSIDDGGASLGLRLTSAGTLTLTGSNHYGGTTDIAAGTLRANGAGSLPSTSAVQLAAGAVLALGQDQTAGSLAGAGRVELGRFTLATGADGSDTAFSGSVVGSGGLSKLGSGRFTLTGSGAHTGATRVEAGELVLASAGALNDVTAVTVEAGALLTVQQSASLGSLAGAGTVDLQAPLLSVGANGSSTRWDGAITGSGGLAKLGAGTFTLAGHNTLAGDLQVSAGSLQLDGGGVRPFAAGVAPAPAVPVVPPTAGVRVAGGATLELLSDQALGALSGSGQVLLNPFTLTLGASGRDSRFDGVISGSGGLVKQGIGTLVLGGANLFTGSTSAEGGLLTLDVAQALAGASALVIAAPARVQVNAAQAVASLNGAGGLALNGATLASGADGSDSRFDGSVSGSGGLVKQGAGVMTLTAANSYAGGTVIEAGTLRLADQGSLGSGDIRNQGQLRLDRSDAFTLAPAISGSGSLVLTQGQVTLTNAANSYLGATQVLGGSLITTAAERLPDASAVQVAAGAQLQLGGNETLLSLQAAGSVRLTSNLTTRAEQVYTGSLTLANPAGITLAGTLIDASRSTNQFAGTPLGLAGGQALVTVKETLKLGDVSLTSGGRIEAERLALDGKLQLSGGSLSLVATAAPDDAKATLLGTAQVPVAGQPMALAEATVQQGSAGAITLAEGASLAVAASGGGSVLLGQDANSFKGQLAVLSGAKYDTAWTPNAKGSQAIQSLVRVAGQQVLVGGSGIEADTVYIRADQLATAGSARLVARMPFDEIVLGRALSAPGLTLELAPGAFGLPGSFGSVNGQPIQIAVGSTETGSRTTGPNAGYLTVLPKAGAQGATAVVLVGPKVGSAPATGGPGYRFFHDGASQATEVPVVYNGVLPLTPAASGAISSINGDAEDARRARFQETVRTENVTVRLRSGVIAEVGPGRPSTQGSEGAKPPEQCDPAEKPALSCKPSTLTP